MVSFEFYHRSRDLANPPSVNSKLLQSVYQFSTSNWADAKLIILDSACDHIQNLIYHVITRYTVITSQQIFDTL